MSPAFMLQLCQRGSSRIALSFRHTIAARKLDSGSVCSFLRDVQCHHFPKLQNDPSDQLCTAAIWPVGSGGDRATGAVSGLAP